MRERTDSPAKPIVYHAAIVEMACCVESSEHCGLCAQSLCGRGTDYRFDGQANDEGFGEGFALVEGKETTHLRILSSVTFECGVMRFP